MGSCLFLHGQRGCTPPKKTVLMSDSCKPPKHIRPTSIDELVTAVGRFSRSLGSPKFAIELSGGLDTSLLISIAKRAGLNPALIGILSSRYEFRTERVIQDLYAAQDAHVSMIAEDSALPMTRLKEVPAHFLPNKSSLFYSRHRAVAKAASNLGCKFVVHGIGLEPLLVAETRPPLGPYLDRLAMDDRWAEEYVFPKLDGHYVNISKMSPFFELLRRLRPDEPEDPHKWWARHFFSKILPSQLALFSYKADFSGAYISGLESGRDDIGEIARVAFEVSGNDELQPSCLLRLVDKSAHLSHDDDVRLMANLSFATWVYGLVRDELI